MAAKKTTTITTLSKSAFIRSQPTTATAREVVAAGQAAGLAYDEPYVHKIRARAKASAAAAARATVNAGASKAAAPAATTTMTKADFVRAHGDLGAKDLVKRASEAGMKLTESYIYNVRGYDKAAAQKSATTAPKARPAAAPQVVPTRPARAPARALAVASTKVSAEELLKAVASEIGLGRALEILGRERARVRAVIGG